MIPTRSRLLRVLLTLLACVLAFASAPPAHAAGGPAAAAVPSPTYTLPVHAVIVSDGTHTAAVSAAEIQQWVDYANNIYDEAGVQFSFDKTNDLSYLTNANLSGVAGDADSNWTQVVADGNAEAAQHPGKVTVFFRYGPIDPDPSKVGPTGGGFSDDSYNFIVMPGFQSTSVCGHQNIGVFAHEAGHFLGLAHTFAVDFDTQAGAKSYFDSNGKKPSLFDGDGLADTPPDPFSRENYVQCNAATTSVTISGVTFPLPRTNIMSYYDNVSDLSDDQIAIVRQTIESNVHNLFPSDPAIAASADKPISTSLYKNYDSPDVWVDTELNGWGTYPTWQGLDAGGAPQGQGDSVWLNHVNRIHFRLRNLGPAAAPNVRVQISLIQPIAFYTQCGAISHGQEAILSTENVGTLDPGEVYHDFVEWTPNSTEPALIKVKILPTPFELSLGNNAAQETLAAVYFPPGSITIGGPATQVYQIAVGNPCPWLSHVIVTPVDKFPKWDVTIDPASLVLPPGAQETVQVRLLPPPGARAGELAGFTLGLYARSGDHLEPLGVLTLTGHVALPTALTCTPPRAPATVGGVMPLAGLLEPSPGSRSLALEYVAPDGSHLLRSVRTNAAGAFNDRFTPDQIGGWSVQAYWEGDAMYQPSMSAPCAFQVGDASAGQESTFSPSVSTHKMWYRGPSCGARDIDVSVQLSGPAPASMVLFYRLRSGAETTPWNEGVAMSPVGAGRFRLNLASQSIPGVTGFVQATLQYQFVATGPDGAVLARSPVYGDVEVKVCNH